MEGRSTISTGLAKDAHASRGNEALGSTCLAGCARRHVKVRLWWRVLLRWSARGGCTRRPTCGLCLECVSGGVL